MATKGQTAAARVTENSPLGFDLVEPALQPVFDPAKFNPALEFRLRLRQLRVRSRCSAKLRDYESGLNLDYFGARYFAGAMGRFTSADAPLADQWAANPQSWNLFEYDASGNLLTKTDARGTAVSWARYDAFNRPTAKCYGASTCTGNFDVDGALFLSLQRGNRSPIGVFAISDAEDADSIAVVVESDAPVTDEQSELWWVNAPESLDVAGAGLSEALDGLSDSTDDSIEYRERSMYLHSGRARVLTLVYTEKYTNSGGV